MIRWGCLFLLLFLLLLAKVKSTPSLTGLDCTVKLDWSWTKNRTKMFQRSNFGIWYGITFDIAKYGKLSLVLLNISRYCLILLDISKYSSISKDININFGMSGRGCSQSLFRRSTGNIISAQSKNLFFES